jgi:DNA-binding winged helix-turn-helix (wHTH) protein
MTLTGNAAPSHRVLLGRWQIDLEHGFVKGLEGPSGLTPRAEALLLLLCRHNGVAVSRDQIFQAVWQGRVVEDAVISNAVWQIRKGLGENGKQILQTRPKRGYALVIPQVHDADDAYAVDAASGLNTHPHTETAENRDLPVEPDGLSGALPVRRAGWSIGLFRKPAALAVSAAFLIACILFVWRIVDDKRLILSPGDEVSVFVDTSAAPKWLESAVLRSTVEAVELREGQILRFEQPQRRHYFSSPHIEVSIVSTAAAPGVIAKFTLSQGDARVQESFTGSEHQVIAALAAFLSRHLGASEAKPNPAFDDYVSGRTAELRYDNNRAMQYYRSALAKSPHQLQANLALSGMLQDQGRGRELLSQLSRIEGLKGLSPSARCRVDMFLASRAPERLRQSPCEYAAVIVAGLARNNRDVLRSVQLRRGKPQQPSHWKNDELWAIAALIRLHEFEQAEAAIDAAATMAAEVGWRHAQVEIQAFRAHIATNTGKSEAYARIRSESADAMRSLGNLDMAHFYRLEAILGERIVPGSPVQSLRTELGEIADQAHARGNLDIEIEALKLRLAIDRDNPVEWRAMIERIETMMKQAYSPDIAARESVVLIDEIRTQRRFQEALGALRAQSDFVEHDVHLRLWHSSIRFRAHFARDELSDAAMAVDALEKEEFDLADGGELCRYAWLFVEMRDWPRAELYLRRCLGIKYERKSQAEEGDVGLVAQSRMRTLRGEPRLAWSSLQPRIAALLAADDLDRREAESLTLLARHATALPAADTAQLRRALARTEAIAGLDGAGPTLRFGVHMLRWRLCKREGRQDCGSSLPEWAPEDLFEARIAQEAATGAMR